MLARDTERAFARVQKHAGHAEYILENLKKSILLAVANRPKGPTCFSISPLQGERTLADSSPSLSGSRRQATLLDFCQNSLVGRCLKMRDGTLEC